MKAKAWLALGMLAVSVLGCGQNVVMVEPTASPAPGMTAAPSPTALRTGVTIMAEGIVQAAQPALPLAFESGGRVLAVQVQAGDVVRAGEVVATLDDVPARDQVAQAQLGLQQAELALEELTRDADPGALASAQASLASAQAGLASARSSLVTLTSPPGEQQILAAQENVRSAKQALQELLDLPDPDAVQIAQSNLTAAEMQVQAAQSAYDQVADRPYAAMTGEAMNLWQATTNYERVQAEYNQALQGASEEQLAAARSRVAVAQADLDALRKEPDPGAVAAAEAQVTAAEAQVEQAQAALDALLAGATAGDLARAEINLAQAQLTLDSAQRALDGVALKAPATGTVLAVHVAPGALIGAGSPIVTLLDITKLEFETTNLSERDLAQVQVGQRAVVTLKAFPDEAIDATVVRIGLQAGGVVGDAATFPVVLALGETGLPLRPGMTGRVEIQSRE
ncbi:MAG: HlyD family efflux transporter periplasmic adaptor subunit [Anaerolineae bacterium]